MGERETIVAKTREEVLERIFARRAERLGVPLDEARRVPRAKPLFLKAAEKRARQLGITPQEVLESDLRSMQQSSYPSPECLTPEEVQEFSETGSLCEERMGHVENCEPCCALLAAVDPPVELVEQFLEQARQAAFAVGSIEKGRILPTSIT